MPGTERERERADIPRRYVVTRGEGYLSVTPPRRPRIFTLVKPPRHQLIEKNVGIISTFL